MTSRETYQGIRGMARNADARRDSAGLPVLIAETRADRLGEISRQELAEVITDAWAAKAPEKLVREHLGD